jgi:hypothetical protein
MYDNTYTVHVEISAIDDEDAMQKARHISELIEQFTRIKQFRSPFVTDGDDWAEHVTNDLCWCGAIAHNRCRGGVGGRTCEEHHNYEIHNVVSPGGVDDNS